MRALSFLLTAALATCTPAFAAIQVFSGSTNLGLVTQFKCSTGLTCTKSGSKVTAVSSPTLTGTTLNLSSTLNAAGDFSVATNKFNVTAATGNTAIAGTENVVGDFSVATNKFNVTAASGNIAVAGTANVVGNFSVATNKFNVTAASGNTTVAGTLGVTGATTFTGGVAASSGQRTRFISWQTPTLTSGTSTQASTTTVYMTQIFIPANATLTGVKINNAATVGNNKWVVALFDSTGAVVANSALAGATTSGADAYQTVAFTGTYAAVGPAVYWIGAYMNGTTDRFRTIPAVGEFAGLTGTVTGQTFGTVASVTLPTTFTADVGPVAFVY